MRNTVATTTATFRAYNAAGALVDTTVSTIAPGPNSIAESMTVTATSPVIRRVELQFEGGLFEAIDDLTFSNQGPPAPADTTAPVVSILETLDGETFTTDYFDFEASILEANLDHLELTISYAGGSSSFRLDYSGASPDLAFVTSPVGTLHLGTNVVNLVATDLSGNVGSDSVIVYRAAVDAELSIVDAGPWEVPRTPGAPTPLRVQVAETFPGSLDGSSGIKIEAVAPSIVYGEVVINDPATIPYADIDLRADYQSPLGLTTITLRAVDNATGMELDTATIRASVVPSNAVLCQPGTLSYYQLVDHTLLETEINEEVEHRLAGLGAEVFELDFDNPDAEPDADVGLSLTAFDAQENFVDLDANGQFSVGEPVYFDLDSSGTVSRFDQRLKNPMTNIVGSRVILGDDDEGELLTPFPANQAYHDVNGNSRLDAPLEEPIYGNDNDGIVNHGDTRLADPLVAPALAAKTALSVTYMDNFYAPGGLLRLSQSFWAAEGSIQADIDYLDYLQISVNPGPGTNITFSHNSLLVAATVWVLGLPVNDGNAIVQSMENAFTHQVANVLRDQLALKIEDRVEEQAPSASTFLVDGYFTDQEFGLGFCLFPETIPAADDIPPNS